MKHIVAINGSPRKSWNTATLLDKVLEGARTEAPEEITTERIDLYDLSFTGCRSCFACKRIGGKSYGKCVALDDLHSVLERVLTSDGIIIGSPIYYRNITAELHAFLERFMFPYTVYSPNPSGIVKPNIPTAWIYTMNVREEEFRRDHYARYLELWEQWGFDKNPEVMYAFNTWQFDDYSKYVSDCFDEEDKASYRERQFELDCASAFQIGRHIVNKR